jgi:3-oxoadipate enol-lactonase
VKNLKRLAVHARWTMCAISFLLLAACNDVTPDANVRFAQNGDVRIHWQEQGTGSPVLLIMGHRYSSRMWYAAIPALAQHHRVISFDNRGTGLSDTRADFEIQDMAKDALAVMDAAGAESAHVYGVSLGGGIAYELAMEQPQRVRSLVLGCTRLKTEVTEFSGLKRATYFLPAMLMNRILTSKTGNGSAANMEAVAFARDVVLSDPYSAAGVAGQAQATARYATSIEAMKRLTMPALVLHGDEDAAVPYEAGQALAKALPNSHFETLKGAGHNFFLAQREQANQFVLDFLRRVDDAQ